MRKLLSFLLAALLLVSTASAAGGNVIYDGVTQELIFQPGSEYSLTDLFPNFKDVMPGDTLTQPITVRNDQDDHVKVEIYIRSHGAKEGSEEFLSQLRLKVAASQDNEMAYMFDAYANETAQLTDWVCLGMLYSGGEVNLDVTLEVPVTLGNEFQNEIGYLTWEFMVIEYPEEKDDPDPPKTGDETLLWPVFGLLWLSALAIALIVLLWKRRKKEEAQDE